LSAIRKISEDEARASLSENCVGLILTRIPPESMFAAMLEHGFIRLRPVETEEEKFRAYGFTRKPTGAEVASVCELTKKGDFWLIIAKSRPKSFTEIFTREPVGDEPASVCEITKSGGVWLIKSLTKT
jgi:hypothetical protein